MDGPDEKHQKALSSTRNNNDQMAHEVEDSVEVDMEDQMTSELTGPSVVQTEVS